MCEKIERNPIVIRNVVTFQETLVNFSFVKRNKNFPTDIPNVPRGKLRTNCSQRQQQGILAVRFRGS